MTKASDIEGTVHLLIKSVPFTFAPFDMARYFGWAYPRSTQYRPRKKAIFLSFRFINPAIGYCTYALYNLISRLLDLNASARKLTAQNQENSNSDDAINTRSKNPF